MQTQGVEHLWLDLRPVGTERLERQFPTILARCRELGLRPTLEPIPVAPAAHYWMGGVSTDLEAATNLPGLYAVGEVACTGVHGANRLASNSLMECLVFARRLRRLPPMPPPPAWGSPCREPLHIGGWPATLDPDRLLASTADLRQLCWRVAGVERRSNDLAPALAQVRQRHSMLAAEPLLRRLYAQPPEVALVLDAPQRQALRLAHDLMQRLTLAALLIEAALFRQESRGGHFRTDAPASQPFWQCHSLQRRGRAITTEPIQRGSAPR